MRNMPILLIILHFFSEILHVPDLWIFRAPKNRPQIGFFPQIEGPQIGGCTVYKNTSLLILYKPWLFGRPLLWDPFRLQGWRVRLMILRLRLLQFASQIPPGLFQLLRRQLFQLCVKSSSLRFLPCTHRSSRLVKF